MSVKNKAGSVKKAASTSRKSSKRIKKYSSIGKVQRITWLDHNSYPSGWVHPATTEPSATCISVGQVSYEDEKYVQLATNHCLEDGSIGMVMNIIKSCITKRETLR